MPPPLKEEVVVPVQKNGKSQGPWTIGALLNWTAHYLAQKGAEFPRLDTEVLLAFALECRRIDLYTRYEELAPEEVRIRFRELIRQRVEGCPVAYLVGRKEFFALEFEVNRSVLIPRPETEFLVAECLRLARDKGKVRIVDLGTGSGNIPVSIAHGNHLADVTSVDMSADALAVARRNAARHGLAERIRFLQGDLFSPLPAGESFDFILSNPPYIAHEELEHLPVGVRDYEPFLALDGGPGGYQILERIISQSVRFLKPAGYLILEIGVPQEGPVRERLRESGRFALGETVHDYSGHPRVVCGRLSS